MAVLPESSLLADFDIISALPPPVDSASFAAATAECIRVAWACVSAALPDAPGLTGSNSGSGSGSLGGGGGGGIGGGGGGGVGAIGGGGGGDSSGGSGHDLPSASFVILLNHGALRDAVLDACGVPADEAKRAIISRALLGARPVGAPSSISEAGARPVGTPSSISEAELMRLAGADRSVAERLEKYAAVPWAASRLDDLWLWALAGSPVARASPAAHAARDELRAVVRCLQRYGMYT
ncbi:hypothetical protein T492DRAFT_840596 [Pavlovales sp. CCMP2436]|nr:hypothetical protein T492DRAFT_840596 [Pavlovales sp. CCMP2436]